MLTVIICRGLPGSGKSVWAKQMLREHPGMYVRINRDDIRTMVHGDKSWSNAREKLTIAVRDAAILAALDSGMHVIVDETALLSGVIPSIQALVGYRAQVKIQEFDKSLDDCIRDDLKREASVGEQVIRKMYYQHIYQPPAVPKPSYGPEAIICDLDGTLALLNGRDPYQPDGCAKDAINVPLCSILKGLQVRGIKLLFVSGRDERVREQTTEWLSRHMIYGGYLFMRPNGDKRDDAVLKREIYDQNIAEKFNVLCIFDDRPKVIRMWRSLGLFVFDANQAPYEF